MEEEDLVGLLVGRVPNRFLWRSRAFSLALSSLLRPLPRTSCTSLLLPLP